MQRLTRHRIRLIVALATLATLVGCAPTRRERMDYPSGEPHAIYNFRHDGTQWTPHGAYVEYHPNGQKAVAGSLSNGEKHGTWRSWFEDGQLESETPYRHGRRHGQATLWHSNGEKQWTCSYRDGSKHGREMRWMPTGELEWEAEYDNDAVLSYTQYAAGGRKLESLSRERGIERE
jgi:antitoxin component YwqK of YwqJK toxin-antitoxin module